MVAGERCPQALADKWSAGRRFLTSCGPTEITIVNTLAPHVVGQPVSIGVPVPGTSVYVLDEERRPVPLGQQGEMWVGGMGVTLGYLGAQQLTSERYLPDPFHPRGGQMFRTRDVGRWTASGFLEHLSRTDDQVKVRGFRVELDAVSRALEAAPGCTKAVTVRIDARTLGAVITPRSADPASARAAVAAALPYYCVPEVVLSTDQLPLTPRGKVDRDAVTELLRRTAEIKAVA